MKELLYNYDSITDFYNDAITPTPEGNSNDLNTHLKTEEKDFKFILRCVPFCERPFFRYDSTGPSHRNSNLPIPIEEQQVPTPHFHRFVADGKEIAYKTKVLLDEKQSKVLEDISMCVLHFMQEANIKFENFDLISTPGVLPFKMEENIDPLENVQFDIE